MRSKIQAVFGMSYEWKPNELLKEIIKLGLLPIKKARLEGHSIRYRIEDPELFNRFIIKTGHHNGKKIYFVIGYYK